MRLLKSQSILRLVNSYMIDSPQPANISYLWNFGSLLGLCLIIQILTGVFLAMHYTPHVDFAFNSVEHIMRDVNAGWALRYIHANVASFFFAFVYAHIARGLYYSSYKSPRVLLWSIGVIILIVMMATAFLGIISPKWFNNYLNNDTLILTILPCILSDRLETILIEKSLTPANAFEKLDLPNTHSNIKKLTKNKAGVYMIINLVNGKCYVGSANINQIHTRFMKHMVYNLGSDIVAKAVQKYGLENFAFIIIEYVNNNKLGKSNKILLDLETKYLEMLNPEYNILTVAGSSFGYKHSPEVLFKMKENYSEERRNKIAQLNKGKMLPESVIEQMRVSALKRAPMSEDTRIKLSLMSSKAVFAISEKTKEEKYSVSMKEMALMLKISSRTLKRAITNNNLVKKEWRVSFIKK